MASFRIAQNGYNAETDPVDKMLVDSDYQTIIGAFTNDTNTTINAGVSYQLINLGTTLGFVPFPLVIAKPASKIFGSSPIPDSVYQYLGINYVFTGNAVGLLTGDPCQISCQEQSSAYTIDYIYTITYLPSQVTSSNASNPPLNVKPYINIAKPKGNALTDSLQNLAWSSQFNTLQIQSQQSFTISPNSNIKIAHNLGYAPVLFHGFGTDSVTGLTYSLNILSSDSVTFGIDNLYFYAYATNYLSNTTTLYITFYLPFQ